MQKIVTTALFLMAAALANAQDDTLSPILIANVNVFDGANETLIEDTNVVVTGNLITAVSAEPLAVAAHTFTDDAVRISLEAGGKSIEHGFLMNRETMELIKENDA